MERYNEKSIEELNLRLVVDFTNGNAKVAPIRIVHYDTGKDRLGLDVKNVATYMQGEIPDGVDVGTLLTIKPNDYRSTKIRAITQDEDPKLYKSVDVPDLVESYHKYVRTAIERFIKAKNKE